MSVFFSAYVIFSVGVLNTMAECGTSSIVSITFSKRMLVVGFFMLKNQWLGLMLMLILMIPYHPSTIDLVQCSRQKLFPFFIKSTRTREASG